MIRLSNGNYEPVCDECIEDTAEGNLRRFETASKLLLESLERKADEHELEQQGQLKESLVLRQQQQEINDKVRQDILNRRDEIKTCVDEVADVLVENLNKYTKKHLKEIDHFDNCIADQLDAIMEFRNGFTNLHRTETSLNFIEQGQMLKVLKSTEVEMPNLKPLSFVPEVPITRNTLENLFGKIAEHTDTDSVCTLDLFGESEGEMLSSISSSSSSSASSPNSLTLPKLVLTSHGGNDNLKLKMSFKSENSLFLLNPTGEGNCWVRGPYENRGKTLEIVNEEGKIQQTLSINSRVRDLVVYPDRQLVTCPEEMCIKKLTQRSFGGPFIKTTPMGPLFICTTFRDELLVTMTDRKTWSKKPNTVSALVKYDKNGVELGRASKDDRGEDLFDVPYKVSTNPAATMVAVLNAVSNEHRHLVLLDFNMKLLFRYIDHGKVIPANRQIEKLPEKFCVTSVVFDHNDRILLSEMYSKQIQLLNCSCDLLQILVTEDAIPVQMALQNNGELWVGLNNETVKIYRRR